MPPFDGRDDRLADAVLSVDRLVRVRPPWTGAAPESDLLWGRTEELSRSFASAASLGRQMPAR